MVEIINQSERWCYFHPMKAKDFITSLSLLEKAKNMNMVSGLKITFKNPSDEISGRLSFGSDII